MDTLPIIKYIFTVPTPVQARTRIRDGYRVWYFQKAGSGLVPIIALLKCETLASLCSLMGRRNTLLALRNSSYVDHILSATPMKSKFYVGPQSASYNQVVSASAYLQCVKDVLRRWQGK